MPPRPKSTREEIAAAALAIVKEEGLAALSARTLAKRLNVSAGSIFTVLKSMDEVREAARQAAAKEFMEYISDYRSYKPPFKRIGMMIISYGIHEPELFKLLFMTEQIEPRDFRDTLHGLGDIYEISLQLIQDDYELDRAGAEYMFEHMWIHAFGLGAMCAMRVCTMTEAEIGKRLGECFVSMYMFIRSGKLNEADMAIEQTDNGTNPEYGADELDRRFLTTDNDTEDCE